MQVDRREIRYQTLPLTHTSPEETFHEFPFSFQAISNDLSAREITPLQSIAATNFFPAFEEKEEVARMAALAGLMYSGLEDLKNVDALFPRCLVPLPSPQILGITIPTGLETHAFRHGDEVIIAIRGTELTKDKGTLFQNLIADMGIGRHKTNEDLIESLEKVEAYLQEAYGFNLDEKAMQTAKNLIESRVLGHDDVSRTLEMTKRIGLSAASGGATGSLIGSIAGGVLGGLGVAAGLAAPPVAVALGAATLVSGFIFGSGVGAVKETVTCATIMDGYPVLLSYVKALDEYITKLKAAYLTDKDTIVTVGHSLAGYLSALVGAIHADTIYAFNGPGVLFDVDVKETIHNLGLDRKVRDDVTYNAISMASDFIGNLGKRDASLQKLYLPITFEEAIGDFPASHYDSPLTHHGIKIISGVLNNASILHVPRIRFKETEKEPRFEEIKD